MSGAMLGRKHGGWRVFVVVIKSLEAGSSKAFSRVEDAHTFASQQVEEEEAEIAEVYEVAGVEDARKATEALKRGEATFLFARVRKLTPKEIPRTEAAREGEEDPVAEEAKHIARRWLQAYAIEVGWFALPAKRRLKVAKDKDAWLGPKYSTFREALESFKASSVPAHKFVMELEGEPWPFEVNGDESVRDAILREAAARIIPPVGLVSEGGAAEDFEF